MASLLVHIELAGGLPKPASLQALGEGRRIASGLGAALHAFAATRLYPGVGFDTLVSTLGKHGADKIVLASGDEFGDLPMWSPHGLALAAACDEVKPSLVLMAESPATHEIAPRLAARLAAVYVPNPSVQTGPRGEIVLSRPVYGGAYRRRLAADDLGRTLVLTVSAGMYPVASGFDDAELMLLNASPGTNHVTERELTTDPHASLDTARIIVSAGGGVADEDELALVQQLADAMGGELAGTRTLCRRGLVPAGREIGVGGRRVSPRLYISCAASGSSAHLAAIAADTEIVAINIDPDAPIFRVSTYGVIGSLDAVIPTMIEAVRSRSPIAAMS